MLPLLLDCLVLHSSKVVDSLPELCVGPLAVFTLLSLDALLSLPFMFNVLPAPASLNSKCFTEALESLESLEVEDFGAGRMKTHSRTGSNGQLGREATLKITGLDAKPLVLPEI